MGERRKILVVDDTAMFRELESLFLARTGQVLTASDASEALAIARRERPDVIVTDLGMPDMDGDVLCKVVKSEAGLAHTPVVLVVAGDDPTARERAVRAGADDVLVKPLSRIALIDAVNRFLRSPLLRGQKRVSLDTDVLVLASGSRVTGRARNLSRGGMFIETAEPLAPAGEVRLDFALPEASSRLRPTARIVWRRDASGAPLGMGLQFLALDRRATERIEEFVYENAAIAGHGEPARAAGRGA